MLGDYGTNMVAPAMPIVMQKNRSSSACSRSTSIAEFKYSKYFSVLRPDRRPGRRYGRCLPGRSKTEHQAHDVGDRCAEDAEFSRNAADGTRAVKTPRSSG